MQKITQRKRTEGMEKRPPKVELFKDKKGHHRVRVTASNGRIIYSSTEGYHNRKDAISAAVTASEAILLNFKT